MKKKDHLKDFLMEQRKLNALKILDSWELKEEGNLKNGELKENKLNKKKLND